ncbi:MAG: hypothetical protein QXY82_07580 [Desulfurococcaceae archaeon]
MNRMGYHGAPWSSLKAKTVKMVRGHLILIIANAGVIYLAMSGWNYYDIRYFILWHDNYFARGRIFEVYASDLKVAYPPLAVLIFVLTHSLAVAISPGNIFVWRLVDKLPLLVSFNAIYFLLRRNYGKFASNLWLLNFVTYSVISSYQFEPISSLFVLLAILSVKKGRYALYGLFSTIATLIKQGFAVILALPIIELLGRRAYKEAVKYVLVAVVTGALFTLPFFVVDPKGFIEKVLLFHAKRPPQYLSIWAVPAYLVKYELNRVPGWISSAWIFPFIAFIALIFYLFLKDSKEGRPDLETLYVRYIVILMAGFLLLNKVGNINYFLWLSVPLIIFTASAKKHDSVLAKKLATISIFTSFAITVVFGFLTVFVQVVAGYPIFIFEDWNWVPADEFFVKCYAEEPFGMAYVIMLYFRSISALRETCKSLALTHSYFLAFLCAIYAYALCYIIYSAVKRPYKS